MSKKIKVPEEFNVFLDRALEAIDNSQVPDGSIETTINNIAKFRYYLRGLTDGLQDQVNFKGASKETVEHCMNELEEVKKLEVQIRLIMDSLT